MEPILRLICFQSTDGETYYADLGIDSSELPVKGSVTPACRSFDDLTSGRDRKPIFIEKILAPLPRHDLPIYCVGLNYRTHAREAKLSVPANPPLWTKPAASLAAPEEDIRMTKFCASKFPDWEGELVFVTSKECRDVTLEEAASCILGYTAGNDLSCRVFQLPEQNGGQFFYAKAFDKFAPIGPVLISPEIFQEGKGVKLITRVDGDVMQEAEILQDMIYSPARILSFMSQSTTIPAFTAVMTGTPEGVGAFKKPRRFLEDGEVVEVEITKIGVLKNKIVFPEGKQSNM